MVLNNSGVAQTLGTEWADRGVRVNCMSPGIVNTALIQVRGRARTTQTLHVSSFSTRIIEPASGRTCHCYYGVSRVLQVAQRTRRSLGPCRQHADDTAETLQESKDLQPLVKEWLTQIPAARLAEVTDLQAAMVYMASDASDYMVGHNLVIDGGQSVW